VWQNMAGGVALAPSHFTAITAFLSYIVAAYSNIFSI
jgi:hypothetical protein